MSTHGGNENSDNPFASPEPGQQLPPHSDQPAGHVVTRSSVDYLECYTFVFENPNWFVNVLLLTLMQFIPAIGGIIVMGYEGEMIGRKATGQSPTYIDFDFNSFVAYLIRGLWIFLITLIPAICLVPFYVAMAVLVSVAESSGNDAVAGIGLIIFIPVIMVLVFLATFIMQPMILLAALRCEFMAALDMAWIRDFLGKMWVEQLLGTIIILILGMLIGMVGLLFCFVGVYPAMIIAMYAYWHFMLQLYQVYVHRGGKAVPFVEAQT